MSETNDNEPNIREVLRSVAGSMVGAVTVACIIAGHRTGLYQAMSGRGPLSADDVAASAGTNCLLYTSPSPRDATLSRMPSSA